MSSVYDSSSQPYRKVLLACNHSATPIRAYKNNISLEMQTTVASICFTEQIHQSRKGNVPAQFSCEQAEKCKHSLENSGGHF